MAAIPVSRPEPAQVIARRAGLDESLVSALLEVMCSADIVEADSSGFAYHNGYDDLLAGAKRPTYLGPALRLSGGLSSVSQDLVEALVGRDGIAAGSYGDDFYLAMEHMSFGWISGIGRQHGSSVHAQVLFEAAWDMMFGEGFVHCDLHQGNVYALDRDKLAILDAGYSVELPWKVKDALSDFFSREMTSAGRNGPAVLEGSIDHISKHPRQPRDCGLIHRQPLLLLKATVEHLSVILSDFTAFETIESKRRI